MGSRERLEQRLSKEQRVTRSQYNRLSKIIVALKIEGRLTVLATVAYYYPEAKLEGVPEVDWSLNKYEMGELINKLQYALDRKEALDETEL